MNRRFFLQAISEALAVASIGGIAARPAAAAPTRHRSGQAIDRRARVARHSPVIRAVDQNATLSVGNGRFVYTADVTGLQTFPESYTELPLATQAEWGWHSFPNPEGYTLEQALTPHDHYGRPVLYADRQNTPAGAWLRQNPHRLSLGRIGFRLRRADGSAATASDLTDIEQRLDLWSGTLVSRFRLDGRQVQVTSAAHPDRDQLAVRVETAEGPADRLGILFAFPYGSSVHTGDPADWTKPEAHATAVAREGPGEIAWSRTLDQDHYAVRAAWQGGGSMERTGAHEFLLTPTGSRLELVVDFAPEPSTEALPGVDATLQASADRWQRFWSTGGAIDLSGTAEARAAEIERRIVLSEYLTALQCSGSMPPQETGLTFNSWHGKSHLEMHWWHAAHFALWDRVDLLRRSLPWYNRVLPRARETARMQGYTGARWGKMIGPDGRESPSGIGPFLAWQQPHPIYYGELVWRATEDRAFLEEYAEVVFATAEFMSSYPHHDRARDRYILGPPLIPAQELHPAGTTFNPTFELAYWVFALETAQRWRERLGLPREPRWERVRLGMSALPVRDGVYLNAESDQVTWTDLDKRRDHPSLLGALGFVPRTQLVDPETMGRTLRRVMSDWQWEETWGWDYPLTAMTAARLGEPEIAIQALLMETGKNRYHPNGHNYQRPGLSIYLPGNGGLLYATGMMAAGWDGAPRVVAPGFPRSWTVRAEGLRMAP